MPLNTALTILLISIIIAAAVDFACAKLHFNLKDGDLRIEKIIYLHHRSDPWIQQYTNSDNLCQRNRCDKWCYSCKDLLHRYSDIKEKKTYRKMPTGISFRKSCFQWYPIYFHHIVLPALQQVACYSQIPIYYWMWSWEPLKYIAMLLNSCKCSTQILTAVLSNTCLQTFKAGFKWYLPLLLGKCIFDPRPGRCCFLREWHHLTHICVFHHFLSVLFRYYNWHSLVPWNIVWHITLYPWRH